MIKKEVFMMRERTFSTWLRFFTAVVVLAATTAGCTIKLISDYDETTDKAVTQLQRKVDGFLVDMQRKAGTPEAAYARNAQFYDEARVDVDAIRVRVQAIPKNDITVQQITLIQDSLEKLEQLHKLGFSSPEEIAPLRTAFDTSFTAILKLELAKKRGEKI
jgi:hypothetical protein